MATIDDLLSCIDDPDDDSTRAYELVRQLAESQDRSLVPGLTQALRAFLEDEHFYGRDVVADALAEIEGIEALPTLIQASAVDIGDDQDSLQSTIIEVMYLDTGRARAILDQLTSSSDSRVRDRSEWARSMVDELLDPQR